MPTGTPRTRITTTSTEGGSRAIDRDYGRVSELFGALASPVRAAIVHRLSERACTVSELVDQLAVSQPLVSQHLRTLRAAGLVAADRRGRAIMYRLADDHVAHIFLDALQHTTEIDPD